MVIKHLLNKIMRKEEIYEVEGSIDTPFTDDHEVDMLASELGFYGYGGKEYDLAPEEFDEFYNLQNPRYMICVNEQCKKRKRYYKSLPRGTRKKRKSARAKAWKKYPRIKIKQMVKDGAKTVKWAAKGVGKTIAKVGLFPIRKAFLGLAQLNYRGIGTKINASDSNARKKMDKVWKKFGGKTSTFWRVMKKGAKKKPFFCGKKCKSKLKKGFDGSGSDNLDLHTTMSEVDNSMNYEGVVTMAVIGAWVGTATGVMTLITPLISKTKASKKIDAEEKAVGGGAVPPTTTIDPVKEVQNNPNLSSDEKKAGISEINDALGQGNMKYFIIGGGILLLSVLGYFMFKKK